MLLSDCWIVVLHKSRIVMPQYYRLNVFIILYTVKKHVLCGEIYRKAYILLKLLLLQIFIFYTVSMLLYKNGILMKLLVVSFRNYHL